MIYVASSWRNVHQPGVVELLRVCGHVVYDFRHPIPNTGFAWEEVATDWKDWTPADFKLGLRHPRAELGFVSDMTALRRCHACLLVQPCGSSAHLELGWAAGAGKATAVYYPFPERKMEREAELMLKVADTILLGFDELHRWAVVSDATGEPVGRGVPGPTPDLLGREGSAPVRPVGGSCPSGEVESAAGPEAPSLRSSSGGEPPAPLYGPRGPTVDPETLRRLLADLDRLKP